ncbi:hypothetical protein I6F65_02495 [Pseudoalteromonas sp. SWXJZ94C]|uniref:hypothetical protein n=1 Tax=unclassified Pseudoalteromonas TaxID=194690 RepID=UPI000405B94E|nr:MULTISPECIES: hypothetical protein [unclassified Pseudoalteromonas]MBH0055819.1 hypothetical protein [Pseudoalteromonas sp. SWXJZ94C]
MSQLTLNQRLATLQPQVDLNLFESSLDYRNRILCLLAQQEQTLATINKEFGQQQPTSFGAEKRFVLGYN